MSAVWYVDGTTETAPGPEMTEKASFGTLLKHYRQVAGLSQEALAARAGLSARAISDLERGVYRTPRYDTLELLSSALSLSSQQHALLQAAARPELAAPEGAPPASPSRTLPLPPTRLVGRSHERSAALALVRQGDTRLLTLTGPSGAGKTRLALQLAWDLAPEFAGVVYVPLAPIRDPALVPGTLAQALGLREQGSGPVSEQVRAFLCDKHWLLVLDNVEQVLDSASFLADLLSSCPRVYLLVTSRMPLHLRAERELPLGPLPLEDAVALFRERAQATRPAPTYDEGEVAAICEQVDRLPLAIELAAMHVKALSLSELRARLDHRLALLRGGARDLPARQQTMEDAIDWSYELLSEQQKCCFRALGVFVGGWSLEAAEAVAWDQSEAAAEESILTVAALVDASLIQAETSVHGAARFGMLELIREYALRRLEAAGEAEVCRRRHAAYYTRLAETVMAHFGPEPGTRAPGFVPALAQELLNARAALAWAEDREEAELGLRLTGFARLWHVRGQMSEAEGWFERMLALDLRARQQGKPAAPLTVRIQRLYGLARTMIRHGRVEARAEAAASEALRLAGEIGDQDGISSALATLGMIHQANDKLEEAEAAFAESYAHAGLIGHAGLLSRALFHRAEVAALRGDVERATSLLAQARAKAESVGMTWDIPIFAALLGRLALQRHDYMEARARYREALSLYRAFGSPTYVAACLEGFAATVCAEGHYALAARMEGVAAALREQTQTPRGPTESQGFEQVVARARAALGERVFEREWSVGKTLTLEQAIEVALMA